MPCIYVGHDWTLPGKKEKEKREDWKGGRGLELFLLSSLWARRLGQANCLPSEKPASQTRMFFSFLLVYFLILFLGRERGKKVKRVHSIEESFNVLGAGLEPVLCTLQTYELFDRPENVVWKDGWTWTCPYFNLGPQYL